jgi:hypothetical protein
MYLELERKEETLLCGLVAARLRQLEAGGDWPPGEFPVPACGLLEGWTAVEERTCLQNLLRRLHEAEWDVTC